MAFLRLSIVSAFFRACDKLQQQGLFFHPSTLIFFISLSLRTTISSFYDTLGSLSSILHGGCWGVLSSAPSIRVNGEPISLVIVGDGFSSLRGISLESLFVLFVHHCWRYCSYAMGLKNTVSTKIGATINILLYIFEYADYV